MRRAFALIALIAAPPALAEVKSSSESGLEVSHSVVVAVSPAEAYAALGRIGAWWSSAHSWSGDAANMSLPLAIGACWCEKLPKSKGEVEHGRVTFANPGAMLRLRAGLGPVHGEAAAGVLTWTIKAEGTGSRITQSYIVGGFVRGGAAAYAKPIDAVMTEQLTRLQSYLSKPR